MVVCMISFFPNPPPERSFNSEYCQAVIHESQPTLSPNTNPVPNPNSKTHPNSKTRLKSYENKRLQTTIHLYLKNKVGYMATPVACGWAGVVFEVT